MFKGAESNYEPSYDTQLCDGEFDWPLRIGSMGNGEMIEYVSGNLLEADAEDRLNTVAHLIEGIETPYGLELLATVHWVADDASDDPTLESIVEGVHSWSERKRETFHANHIKKAWSRLNEQGLLATSAT